MASGDVVNTAARLQAAAPDRTASSSTRRPTARPSGRSSTTTPSSIEAKGKAAPVAVWEALRARARVGVERVGGAPLVGREQELTLLRETLRPRDARARAAAGHARRRSRYRQEPARLRALPDDRDGRLRARLLAPWPLAPVRRRSHVLGARRDGQGAGRDPRVRRPGRRPRRSSAQAVERFVPASGRRGVGRAAPSAARRLSRRRRRRATGATRRSPRGAASSRRSLTSDRSSSSSKTCTGPTKPCSTSSTTSSTGRAACHFSSSARHVPSCSPGAPAGAAARSTRRRSCSRRSRRTRPPRSCTRCSAAPRSTLTCQARLLEHAGGNPLYAEEFTRMLRRAARRRRAPRDGAGHHRRAAGHAPARGEGAAPGRRRDRQDLLARRARRASAGRSRSGCTRSSGRSS